jgi:MGT family glycosyltransferase
MTQRHFLFALWEGGGTLPPQLGLARRLIDAGHRVSVIADPTVEDDAVAAGCEFNSWVDAPHRTTLDPDEDPMKDWEVSNPLVMIRRARDGMIAGPAGTYASDTRRAISTLRPDAVVADHLLAGVIIGAQAEGLPVATLVPNIWMIPTDGAPAVGPGFPFPSSRAARLRDRLVTSLVNRVFDRALPTLDAVRHDNGLDPLDRFYDQMLDVDRILVLTSPTFDFSSAFTPDHATYVGPILDDPHWTEQWVAPWPDDDERPLVLASLSSTFQDQTDLLRRIVAALGMLDVRAVVTLGQNIDLGEVPSSGDVHVVQSAPHSQILPRASATITHCGHGTTVKALSAGVPMLCIPMGRDQNDNAARVVHQGAGLRLTPKATPRRIADGLSEILRDDRYRDGARRMSEQFAVEAATTSAVAELETIAAAPDRRR